MEVLMPQLGETVTEGRITTWYKSIGEMIEPGENLFEIETEKVSMEVPATTAGVLSEIRVSAGESAVVGAVVAIITDEDSETAIEAGPTRPSTAQSRQLDSSHVAAAPASRSAPLNPFQEVVSPIHGYGPARVASGIQVTPFARRLAAEQNIDLVRVTGTGLGGRISGRDVAAFAGGEAATSPVKQHYDAKLYTEIAVDRMRAAIARRLTESKRTIPHFQLSMDIEIDQLLGLRQSVNDGLRSRGQTQKISLNDVVISFWAAALAKVPDGNVVWAGDTILRFSRIDIGVAVSVPGGLLTPVLRDIGHQSAVQVSESCRDLIERARLRKLLPDELRGGVSTVTNLGMYGVRQFAAIINPPQSTILAVGSAERRAFETSGGGVRFATCMNVTLGCDHRVIDGVLGAQLLAALRECIRDSG